MFETRFFDAAELLPAAWQGLLREGPVRVFNPGLLAEGEGWIFAFRAVGHDELRRIGLCRLDRDWAVVPGSAVAWSDSVRFPAAAGYSPRAAGWFADPRLYRLGGGLYLSWNSGWHDPENHQFLQALDAATLRPIGSPREMRLRGPRLPIEKNWTFFGTGPQYALYSLCPQRVLQFSLEGEGPVEFSDFAGADWDNGAYAREFGPLRGGAPPQRVGDDYFGIGHSIAGTPDHYRYVAAAYRFSASRPFAFLAGPSSPLPLGPADGAARRHPRLNPAIAEVVYPCGAAWAGGRWVVSYGVNDERCAIAVLPHAAMLDSLRAV